MKNLVLDKPVSVVRSFHSHVMTMDFTSFDPIIKLFGGVLVVAGAGLAIAGGVNFAMSLSADDAAQKSKGLHQLAGGIGLFALGIALVAVLDPIIASAFGQ